MTTDNAWDISEIWGLFMEHAFGKLNLLFPHNIPESFLPYQKEILEEAFFTIINSKDGRNENNIYLLFKENLAILAFFIDDNEALLLAAEKFRDEEWRTIFLAVLKDFQSEHTKIVRSNIKRY